MQSLLGELINSIVQIPAKFTPVATNDPLAALMLLAGAVLIIASMGVFGYLSLGAVISVLIPEPSGRAPPRAEE